MFRTASPVFLALGLAACGGDSTVRFSSEPPSGASVYLVYEPTSREQERFAVHAVDIEGIYGLAFRLTYDAGALRYANARIGADWPSDAVALAREVEPGSLWIAWTAKGPHDGITSGRLGEIEFAHTLGASSDLRFRVERSAVFGVEGVPIKDVTWLGGRLVSP